MGHACTPISSARACIVRTNHIMYPDVRIIRPGELAVHVALHHDLTESWSTSISANTTWLKCGRRATSAMYGLSICDGFAHVCAPHTASRPSSVSNTASKLAHDMQEQNESWNRRKQPDNGSSSTQQNGPAACRAPRKSGSAADDRPALTATSATVRHRRYATHALPPAALPPAGSAAAAPACCAAPATRLMQRLPKDCVTSQRVCNCRRTLRLP